MHTCWHRRFLCAVLGISACGVACAQRLDRYEQTQMHMGVAIRVVLYADRPAVATTAMQTAFEQFRQLDQMMSDYRDDSELATLNSATSGDWIHVSRPLWELLQISDEISRQTDGAFDVTIGPASQLWRRVRQDGKMPSYRELQHARQRIGFEKLAIDPDQPRICFCSRGVQLDLGGIAKGFAADQAIARLKELGIGSALIDASGDISVSAPPPGETGWAIGMKQLDPEQLVESFLRLQDCGIATSGDARQFIQIGPTRYSHIVDPRTAIGLTMRSSVTVIAENCTLADGYASALSVMGPQRAIRFADSRKGLAARVSFLDGQSEQPTTLASTRFPPLLQVTDRRRDAPR